MTDNAGAMPVSTFTADPIATIRPDADLWETAEAMADADVGLLVLRHDGDDEIAGVVSERDMVRAFADARDPARTTAGDIGSRSVVCCDLHSTVAEVAEEMMECYVRHVLVVDDGRPVGIVGARDLLGAYVTAEVFGDG